jgi:hypothetical protein
MDLSNLTANDKQTFYKEWLRNRSQSIGGCLNIIRQDHQLEDADGTLLYDGKKVKELTKEEVRVVLTNNGRYRTNVMKFTLA